MSFRQPISSFSKGTMLEVDLDIVEIFELFVVFDAISVQFPRVFLISSITINNERTSYALHFLKRTLLGFASKTLINFIAFNIFVFKFLSNLCLLFESFWIHNDGNCSTKNGRIIQSTLEEIFADIVWKMARN